MILLLFILFNTDLGPGPRSSLCPGPGLISTICKYVWTLPFYLFTVNGIRLFI